MKVFKFLVLTVLVFPCVGCKDPKSTPIPPENPSQSPVVRMEQNGGEIDPGAAISPEVEPES